MEPLVEMQLGILLEGLGGDTEILGDLVVDEIERSLSKIISGLKIPQLLDWNARQRLEFQLMGRRGFRPLSAADRRKAIDQLKDQGFSELLREIQQGVSGEIHASTSRSFVWGREAYSGLTNQLPTELAEAETIATDTFSGAALASANPETANTLKGPVELVPNTVEGEAMLGVSREKALATTVIAARTHEKDILEVPNTPIELQETLAERDIRGLIALLRAGRLVAFLEPSASELIPRAIDRICVPDKKVYASLKSEDLLLEYHGFVVSETVNQSPELLNELRLLDALLVSLENEAQWSRINKRRFHLINKKYAVGLTPPEQDELATLDDLAQKQMYAALKLPFSELAMLESYARNLGPLENS